MKKIKTKFLEIINKIPSWLLVGLILLILIILNLLGSIGNLINPYDEEYLLEDLENEFEMDILEGQSSELEIVEVVDFSNLSKEEIKRWCKLNNIYCNIITREIQGYNKDEFVKQSVKPGKKVYEGDMITVVYSLGRKETIREKNLLDEVESYANLMNSSKKLTYDKIKTLEENYTKEEIEFAFKNSKINWNRNALEKAKAYSAMVGMKKKEIYEQLLLPIEGLEAKEAEFAVRYLGLK